MISEFHLQNPTVRRGYGSLLLGSMLVALLSSILAYSLKTITAIVEEGILERIHSWPILYILLPSVGITIIYFTRKYLFKNRKNTGIKEIFQTLENRRDELPAFKVASHYINGFFTVIFGGSTGVEVSTVVATAAIGAMAQRRRAFANMYKTELVCAGVAAGIATLFGNPLVGFLFAVEVISRKLTVTIFLSGLVSAAVAAGFIFFFDSGHLFHFEALSYAYNAVPYMLLLSLLAGALAVYFTKSVILIKERFSKIDNPFLRVNVGAILVGLGIYFFPQLYGDSYHALPGMLGKIDVRHFDWVMAAVLLCLAILKPLAASLTLGAGGDGGVFAPSIVAGAFLGMLIAILCNHFLNTDLVIVNFALIGAAAMLSAAIHAPLTSLFLICGLVPNGFTLFLPILASTFLAKYMAKRLCSYNVYTYRRDVGKVKIKLK